jgi:antitoxin VapB
MNVNPKILQQKDAEPKTAKLFMNGRSQAVRLPAEFRFEGTEVNIRRDPETDEVILSPKPQRTGSWDRFFEALSKVRPGDVPEGFPWRDQRQQERDDPFGDDPVD